MARWRSSCTGRRRTRSCVDGARAEELVPARPARDAFRTGAATGPAAPAAGRRDRPCRSRPRNAAAPLDALDAVRGAHVGDGFGALSCSVPSSPCAARERCRDQRSDAARLRPRGHAGAGRRALAARAVAARRRARLTRSTSGSAPPPTRAAGSARWLRRWASSPTTPGQSSWSPSRRELRAIAVPVALVTGPQSAGHTVAAADAAAALLPDARRSTVGDVVAAALALLR